jgi:hypothetical protein
VIRSWTAEACDAEKRLDPREGAANAAAAVKNANYEKAAALIGKAVDAKQVRAAVLYVKDGGACRYM